MSITWRIGAHLDRADLHDHCGGKIEAVGIVGDHHLSYTNYVRHVLSLHRRAKQYPVLPEKVLLYEVDVLAARKLLHECFSQLKCLCGVLRLVCCVPGSVSICFFLCLILNCRFAVEGFSRGERHKQRQRKREGCCHC